MQISLLHFLAWLALSLKLMEGKYWRKVLMLSGMKVT